MLNDKKTHVSKYCCLLLYIVENIHFFKRKTVWKRDIGVVLLGFYCI